MKAKGNLRRRMASMFAAWLMLASLAACSSYNPANSTGSSGASGSRAVTQNANSNSSQTVLPSADATEAPLKTAVAEEQTAGTPTPEMHSLVNVPLNDLARTVAATSRPRSGTAQVLLARSVTPDELVSMELYCYQSSVVETPPLALIIVKGDFAPDVPTPNSAQSSPTTSYIAYVFDLWAGAPTLVLNSVHGGTFRKALNDPTLPSDAPVGYPTPRPPDCSAAPSAGSRLLHYGDTSPGILMGPNTIHQADFGSWSYSTIKEASPTEHSAEGSLVTPNQPYAQVRFNGGGSMAALQQYIDANKQMVAPMSQRSGQVEAWIVFKDYVPVDQFRSFAQTHKLTAGVSYLRAIDENPNPLYAPYYKLQIVPADGKADPLPQAAVDSAFNKLHADTPQLSLKGVYATHAWLDAKDLSALAADPSVYYVDLTANAVRDDLAKAGVAGAAQAVVETPAQMLFALVEKPWQSK